jgi:hypothetical protein
MAITIAVWKFIFRRDSLRSIATLMFCASSGIYTRQDQREGCRAAIGTRLFALYRRATFDFMQSAKALNTRSAKSNSRSA